MGLFSLFSKSSPPDYETLLARLSTEIDEVKTHLSQVRLKERRWSLLVNAYGIALWAVWVGLWYVRGLPLGLFRIDSQSLEYKAIGGGGIAAGPIFLWALNRTLHFVFRQQRNKSETKLRSLLAKQRKHLDEIKKATNYDSTRKLIERYDESTGSPMSTPQHQITGGRPGSNLSTPVRGTPGSPSPAGRNPAQSPATSLPLGQGGTPRAPGHLAGAGGTPAQPIGIAPEGMTPDQAAALQTLQMHAIQPVLPTPEKRWYDRVVDSILGEDPAHASQSKFALVCGECFRHNGLVGTKYEWERMQWICPRCNHMNPAPLSKLRSDPMTNATPQQPQLMASPQTPSHLPRAAPSPRPRRQLGDRATPRSSKLGKEVFSASEENSDEDNGDAGRMDVDDEK